MKPTRAAILNRAGQIPSDGWYQIEVSGTHPAGTWPDKRPRRQVLDEKALTSIVNRFQAEKAEAGENWAGVLVDADHLSYDLDNPTEALAWAQDLRIHEGQLEAKLDLSDLGDTAIRNRRYKFFSTEYDPEDVEDLGNGDVRPLRLSGLAFTNRPNNRGARPITNRSGDQPGTKPTPQNQPMKSIAEALGLPAESDEAAILAAVNKLKGDLEAATKKDAETQADVIMNRDGKNIPEAARPHWREQLIKNREATEKLIKESFPADGKRTPDRIFNRADAKGPGPVEGQGDDDGPTAEEKQKASAIRNRANTISKEQRIPFGQAFELAKSELS
jgi:hypothetical protein